MGFLSGTGSRKAHQSRERRSRRDFTRDRYEILIGKTKLLALLNRLAPSIAESILR